MHAGSKKWIQLLLDVLDYEFDEGPLLSEGADTLIDKYPVLGRAVILTAGSIVTLHLANVLDDRFDVMSQLFWQKILKGS